MTGRGVTKRFIFAAAAMLMAGGLSGCHDATSTQLHVKSVVVSGLTTYQLSALPNDSLSFGATLTADPGYDGNRAVTWASSDPTVFRVNPTSGAGRALATGTAVITAVSATDNVTGQLSLAVFPPANPPATTVITGLFQGANPCGIPFGEVIDLTNICGQINVAIDVSYTPTSRPLTVNLSLDGPAPSNTKTPCYTVAFGEAAARKANGDVSTFILTCNTASFDTTTGVTTFKNGSYALRGSLGVADSLTAGSASVAITLNNPDFLRATIVGSTLDGGRTASTFLGAVGVWHGGTVNTKILPVIFDTRANHRGGYRLASERRPRPRLEARGV